MKEEIKGDSELRRPSPPTPPPACSAALAASARGARFLEQRLDPYRSEFGRKAVWSHEFVFPTWFENPAPIVEALRGYLETDYDYPADARGRARRPRRRGRRAAGGGAGRAPRARGCGRRSSSRSG